MRPASACSACRASKRKCRPQASPSGQPVRCVRCEKLNLSCNLSEIIQPSSHRRARPPHPPSAASHTSTNSPSPSGALFSAARKSKSESSASPIASSTLPRAPREPPLYPRHVPLELELELTQLYFKYVHGTHHSLFQRDSVIGAIPLGRLPPVITFGIMALGARFSNNAIFRNEDRRSRGAVFAEKACRFLDLTDLSPVTIQAALLIGSYYYAECKPEAEALYITIANRLASIIDLPRRPAGSEMEKQENLRIYWTLFMHDTWESASLKLPRQFTIDESVPLPADETFWMSLTRKTPPIPGPLPTGIWAERVHLTKILAEIQNMQKDFVAGSLGAKSLLVQVDQIYTKLRDWENSLSPNLKENRANMERHAALGLGPEFICLHLGYHYYHEILFYQFLAEDIALERSQQETATPESLQVHHYAEQCNKHAVAFCDLLYACYTIPGCETLYILIGHMLVVTSTVYIHSLLFAREEEKIALARDRLARNFEILVMLQGYWRTLDLSLARLKKFHNACQSSVESTFRMDKWMLSFILEYGIDMAEKFASTPTPNITSMNFTTWQPPVSAPASVTLPQVDNPFTGDGLPLTFSPEADLQHWYAQTFE